MVEKNPMRRIKIKPVADIGKKWTEGAQARAGYYESEAPAAGAEVFTVTPRSPATDMTHGI